MSRVPDPVYRAHVVPRLLAPAAELLLDALSPFAEGERVLEVDAGLGLVTRVLADRVRKAGAELWAVDPVRAYVAGLGALDGVRIATCGALGELPLKDACVETLLVNGMSARRHALAQSLRDARRVLQPGGRLIATSFIAGTFQELQDLLLESLEARGEGEMCRQLTDTRSQIADVGLFKDVLRKTGFELDVFGEEERSVFPRGSIVQDPLFTVAAPTAWLGSAPALPWDSLAEAVRTYFADAPFSVRVRTAVIRARAV